MLLCSLQALFWGFSLLPWARSVHRTSGAACFPPCSSLGPEGQLSSRQHQCPAEGRGESSLLSLPASQRAREVNAAIGRASMENLEPHSCCYSLGTSCPQSLPCWGVPLPFLEGSALGSEVWLSAGEATHWVWWMVPGNSRERNRTGCAENLLGLSLIDSL